MNQSIAFFGQYLGNETNEVSVVTTDETVGQVVAAFESFLLAMGYHPVNVAEYIRSDADEKIIGTACYCPVATPYPEKFDQTSAVTPPRHVEFTEAEYSLIRTVFGESIGTDRTALDIWLKLGSIAPDRTVKLSPRNLRIDR